MTQISPPGVFVRLLEWFCKDHFQEGILGDLEEQFYEDVELWGERKAKRRFVWNVIRFFRPGIIKNFASPIRLNHTAMLKHHMKIAFRVFKKEKFYSLINVLGLALGFTFCLMIYLFIRDELSYDRFHQDGDQIYRVAAAYMRQNVWEPYSTNSWKTGEVLKAQYPEIIELVRINDTDGIVAFGDKRFTENRMAIVEENFFEVFTFPLISGNKRDVLTGTNKVVISESMAKKYFGSGDPVGKMLEIDDGQIQLQVSGVIEDMPSHSHFHFDFLISGETSRQIAPESLFTNVGWDSQYIYIKTTKSFDPLAMEASFPDFINEHLTPFTEGNFKLFLQPLLKIHLYSDNGTELEANGNINYVYIFSIIAIFILLIACVNYMNLTTARSMRRAREVGMRKVLGAAKRTLIGQFLSESFLMTFIALLLAYSLTWMLLPSFNAFALKEISRSVLLEPNILLSLLLSLALIGFVSGAYPAFFLSAFKPLNTIKGNQTAQNSSLGLRRGLVLLQFVISIGLITSTAIVFKQLDFLQNKDLGIDKEYIVSVPLQTMDRSEINAFRRELSTHHSIIKTGVSNMKLPGWIGSSTPYKAQEVEMDEDARKSMKIIRVDHDFLDLIDAKMVQGRNFSREFTADSSSSLVLNESAIKQLGWKNPVGKWIEMHDRRFTVVGVVKDFHFESLYRKIAPIIFILSDEWLSWAYIKIDSKDIPASLKHIESTYSQFVTNRDFSYSFIDQDMERQYVAEEKFSEIFILFTVLAIILACMGTFGLVSFSAERKSREIGIRKVLGASVGHVTSLLLKEFVVLLLLASLISWPVTWYAMNGWISTFVYRIPIRFGVFVIASVLALVIVVGTTGFRAIKAALANPVDSLRNE